MSTRTRTAFSRPPGLDGAPCRMGMRPSARAAPRAPYVPVYRALSDLFAAATCFALCCSPMSGMYLRGDRAACSPRCRRHR